MDCSPPGSCVHWISQARLLAWLAIPSSRGIFWPLDKRNPQGDYEISQQGGPLCKRRKRGEIRAQSQVVWIIKRNVTSFAALSQVQALRIDGCFHHKKGWKENRHFLPPVVLPRESNLSQATNQATNLKELCDVFMNMPSAHLDCGSLCRSNGPGSFTDRFKEK